jgi:hypothetical protein
MTEAAGSLWREDFQRWAVRRAKYVQSARDIEYKYAITLAYSELGFSSSGIAKRSQLTEPTVRAYLDELAEQFGEPTVYAKRSGEIDVEADIGGGADA